MNETSSHLLIFFLYDFLMTFSLLWNNKEDILKVTGVQTTLDPTGLHCMEKIYFMVRIFKYTFVIKNTIKHMLYNIII